VGPPGATGAAGSLGGANVSVSGGAALTLVNIGGPVANTFANNVSNTVGGTGTVIVNSANTNTLSGALTDGGSGVLALTQSGSGTTNLTNTNNTYTGATNVTSGMMVVSGSISGTSSASVGGGVNPATLNLAATGTLGSLGTPLTSLAVGNNGTLSGNGTVYGAINASSTNAANPAIVAPTAPSFGNTAGLTIASGSLTFGSNSTLQLSLANSQANNPINNQPLASDYSNLTLGAGVSVTLGGMLVTIDTDPINRTDLFTIIVGNTVGAQSTITPGDYFSNANVLVTGTTFQFGTNGYINYAFDPQAWANATTKNLATFEGITGGNSVALYAVPEPSSLGMLLGSLGLALGLQRFRRRRS
jgi:autotransporter-associated beta strand protein